MTAPAANADRPSAGDVAGLLRAYRVMLDDADGWASQIPADRRDAWTARKDALLSRIAAHTAAHDSGRHVAVERDVAGGEFGRGGRGDRA